ncbi:hypothetical protein [Methylogaea oryzae]|uniref:hypothetical protein n=1 Tax=Methylogaea oryzae TaxID=1295382 RepID=UPI0012E309D6|nr:hypothetical protein [Methylogaea oryzae]
MLTRLADIQKYAYDHHITNYWIWAGLVILSLIFVALGAGAALWMSDSKLSGTFAIVNGLIIGLNSGLGFGNSAQFYRQLAADAKVAIYDLESNKTSNQLKNSQEVYRQLQQKLAKDLPVGTGPK